MATAGGVDGNLPSSFKCRRCRQVLFSGDNVLPSTRPGQVGDIGAVSAALWYINDDSQPLWIQRAVEKAQWTRGKLSCPKCAARLGSFDYLSPSIRHCQERHGPWSCVQVISSRVDHEMSLPVLASRGETTRQSSRPLVDASAQGHPRDSMSRHSDRTTDSVGAMAEGCWPLDRDDWQQRLGNCDYDSACPMHVEHGDSLAGPLSEISTRESPSEPDVSSYLVIGHNLDECCGEDSASATPVGKNIAALSSDVLSKRGLEKSTHVQSSSRQDGQPLLSPAHAENDRILFGFFEHEQGKHGGMHPGERIVHDIGPHRRLTAVPSSESSVGSKLTFDMLEADDTHTDLPGSGPVSRQGRCTDVQANAAIETEEVPDSGTYGQPTNTSSPDASLRGFLDEILAELDQEETGLPQEPQTDALNSFDPLVDEMDGDISANHVQDSSQGDSSVSTRLQRAVLRVQRRERNKRKGERRKLRKQERWRERAAALKQGLAEEEETLHGDPDKLLNFLGPSPPSKSLCDALTCPVCLDIYYQPHQCLPCDHVFCEPCLRRLAHTLQTSVTVPCPLCRTVIRGAQLHTELTASIVEMFPHITEQRKKAERKTLNKSFPLPGENAPTYLPEWLSRTVAGGRRIRPHHLQWRGGHANLAAGLFEQLVWQYGAVTLLMVSLVALTAIFTSLMMQHF